MFCHHLTQGTLSFLSSFYESFFVLKQCVVCLKSVIENNCADEIYKNNRNEIKDVQI